MSMESVKKLMQEAGWGYLATTDGKKVGVRPMGGCVWMENELWWATFKSSEKVNHLQKVPYAEYCFSDKEGRHARIAGSCTISTNNDDKRRLYEAVPVLKKYIDDPTASDYVVIRMKPERIRLMNTEDMKYQEIKVSEE